MGQDTDTLMAVVRLAAGLLGCLGGSLEVLTGFMGCPILEFDAFLQSLWWDLLVFQGPSWDMIPTR